MKKRIFLIMSLVAALGVGPIGVYGKEETSGPLQTPLMDHQTNASAPPVEQPLVPEGVFAVQLAEALKMGQAQDEAQAESLLSAVGIEPKNGWIAGYPVTPPVLGEIEKAIAGAADAGRLGMRKEQALKAVADLKSKLGLGVTAGTVPQSPGQTSSRGQPASTVIYKYVDRSGLVHYTDQYESIPKEYRDQSEMIREVVHPQPTVGPAVEATESRVNPGNDYTANPGPEVINNYYYNDGPPVITYYEPPQPYYYLYSWVPYPFWCSGFFFPGFFILHDFHRHVFVHRHPFVVTNHVVVVKGGTRNVFIVDPVSRGFRGSMGAKRVTSPQVFNSSRVQSSARAIVGLSQTRTAPARVSTAPRMPSVAPSTPVSRPQSPTRGNQGMINGRVSPPRNNFVAPQAARGRTFSPPAVTGRSFSPTPGRVFSSPPVSQGRAFSVPSTGGRGSVGESRGVGGLNGHGRSFGSDSRGHR